MKQHVKSHRRNGKTVKAHKRTVSAKKAKAFRTIGKAAGLLRGLKMLGKPKDPMMRKAIKNLRSKAKSEMYAAHMAMRSK